MSINSADKTERRFKGEGSLYYKESKELWCAQVDLGTDSCGKRIRKTVSAKTRPEVIKKMRALIAAGIVEEQNKEKVSVFEYTKLYLNEFKRNTVSCRTFEWYVNMSKHIQNGIGDILIQELTTLDIQKFYNSLASPKEKGAKAKAERTIRSVHTLLNQVLILAVKQKLIPSNPISDGVKLPKPQISEIKKPKAIPAYVCKFVLDAIDKSPVYKPIITVLLHTGMRIGELISLWWTDIDFENQVLHIQRAVTEQSEIDEDFNVVKRKVIIGTTKTVASQRVIPIDQEVVNALAEWKEYMLSRTQLQKQLKKKANTNLVFPNQYGDLRNYQGFQKQFARFLEEGCLAEFGITFHRFRHTFATLMIENGVNPRVVQELLGHKDVETTLSTYTSVTVDSITKATATVSKVMAELKEKGTNGESNLQKSMRFVI